MARFVPRSLRDQAAEPEPESDSFPGQASESRESAERTADRPNPRERPVTAANGVHRRPVPRPAASAAPPTGSGEEAFGESGGEPAADVAATSAGHRDADAVGPDDPEAPRATTLDDARTGPASGRATDDLATAGPVDAGPVDAEDADRADIGSAPAASGSAASGPDDATGRGAARPTGRTRAKSGALRPKRRTEPGGKPAASAESRVRTGRKVVAAPRAGSNRREKAAQAALNRLRRIALNLAVWTLIVGLLAGTAWYLKDRGEGIDRAGRDATAAASSAAQAIFSYDYRSFDESVANGKDFVTGDFAEEYAKTTAGLKATAVKERAVVQAKVSVASVTYASSDRVEVLLFVNQYRRNVNISGEKVDENRVLLTMEYVAEEDAWLVVDAAAI